MAGFALSAAAATPLNRQATEPANLTPSHKTANTEVQAPTRAKVAARMATRGTVDYETLTWENCGEGSFKDGIFSSMYQIGDVDPVPVAIEKAVDHEIYRVVNPYEMYGFPASYMILDCTNPNMVILPYTDTQFYDDVDGETYIASASYICTETFGDENLTPEEFMVDFYDQNMTLVDGVVYMPAYSVFFQWPDAPADSYYGTDPTGWYAAASASYVQLPGGVVKEEWENIGVGSMVDMFCAPFFIEGLNETPYDIVVEKNTQQEGIYRILDPWMNLYEAAGGYAGEPLVIDVSDPSCVRVEMQETGFSMGTYGLVYIVSTSGLYSTNADFKASDDYPLYNVTMNEEMRIEIPFEAMLFYLPDYDSQYVYVPEECAASYIQLPKTNAVKTLATDENAPVEYYNLQGVRIANPEAGQLVIVRQGSKATKTIVK